MRILKVRHVFGLDLEEFEIIFRGTHTVEPGFQIVQVESQSLLFPIVWRITLGVECSQVLKIMQPLIG